MPLSPDHHDSVGDGVDVSLLVISHGHEKWLPRCIGSVSAALSGVNSEILVLDNLGRDLSASLPSLEIPIRLLSNRQPQGFAANVNYLVSQCRGSNVIVLNPDTEFVGGQIANACDYLRKHPEVGLLACRLLNSDGSVQQSCRPFPTLLYFLIRGLGLESKFPSYSQKMSMNAFLFDEATPVDWVFGAFLMFRRAEFQSIGGMDPGFPLYYEDVDLALRYRQLGKITVYFPKLLFYHAHLRTSAQRPLGRQWWYHGYSAVRFFIKHRYIWKLRLPTVTVSPES